MNPDAKLQKLTDLLKLVDESISREEFVEAFQELTNFVRRVQDTLTVQVDDKISETDKKVIQLINDVTRKADLVLAEAQHTNNTRLKELKKRSLESIDGLFTKMRLSDRFNDALVAYEAKIDELEGRISAVPTIDQILKAIPEKEDVEETPEEVRDKLESLKGEDRLDAKAIKNLPKDKDGNVIFGTIGLKGLQDGDNITVDNENANYPAANFTGYTGVTHITVGPTAPTSPNTFDIWVDTN